MTAPQPVTNKEFTAALAAALRRPAPLMVPAILLRAVMGERACLLLEGQRALPKKIDSAGYRHTFAKLADGPVLYVGAAVFVLAFFLFGGLGFLLADMQFDRWRYQLRLCGRGDDARRRRSADVGDHGRELAAGPVPQSRQTAGGIRKSLRCRP